MCGDREAGIVTLPYEHADFERDLEELRYRGGSSARCAAVMDRTGTEMARILGSVEPASTLVVVPALASPDWLVEIEAVAAKA